MRPRNSKESRQERIITFVRYGGHVWMRTFRVAFILVVVWLLGVDPVAHAQRASLTDAVLHAMEVVALPFRLAWLAARQPDAILLMPVAGAKVSRVADSWGAPRPGGRAHRGQDIFARRGTAVFSATEGYVVRVGRNRLGGNVIVIAGAGGRRYYYAHLETFAPAMRVGKKVTPETVIGFVGNTGNAAQTSPHLHFGLYTMTGAIDPLPLLRDRPASSP
jgi:murein DD-endopeptidase MepM/ murein hydrolase activator NlpD